MRPATFFGFGRERLGMMRASPPMKIASLPL